MSQLRGGVTPSRDLDTNRWGIPAGVVGNQLIITLKGKTARTQMDAAAGPPDPESHPEPYGSGSPSGEWYVRKTVPAYKVFLLKNPQRLVVDFPRSGGTGTTGRRPSGSSQWLGKGLTYRAQARKLQAPVR